MEKVNVDTLWQNIQHHQAQHQWQAAQRDLTTLLALEPAHQDALRLQGILKAKSGDFLAATNYFKRAIKYHPDQVELYNDLGLSLVRQGQLSQAETLYLSGLAKSPTHAQIANNLASLYYKQQDFDKAIFYYQQAITQKPDYLAAHYNLALSYMKLNQFDLAISQLREVILLAPHHGHAHFHLANLLTQSGQLDESSQHYQIAIAQQPALVAAYTNLAAIHLKQNALSDAKKYYDLALALDPNVAQVHFNMGVITADQGHLTQAVSHYEKAIALMPHYPEALQNLGACYYKLNQIPQAIVYYEKAAALVPDNAIVQYLLNALKQNKTQQTTPVAYVKHLFDDYAQEYDSHLQNALHYRVPECLIQAIKKVLSPQLKSWDILDLGCGTGLMGACVKPYARYLLGIDAADNMLHKAEEKAIYDDLTCADLKTWIRQCELSFDLILAADVLGYIGKLDHLFGHIAARLSPQGVFAFSIELTDQADLQLQPTGRFQHSLQSITALAKTHHLLIRHSQTQCIRQQQGLPVKGAVFLLQK